MCFIDSCFKNLSVGALPSERMSHHGQKALCAFVCSIIAGSLLVLSASSYFSPLTPSEVMTLVIYAALTVFALAKLGKESALAISAYKEVRSERAQGGEDAAAT